jgi:hypothetical protein
MRRPRRGAHGLHRRPLNDTNAIEYVVGAAPGEAAALRSVKLAVRAVLLKASERTGGLRFFVADAP